MAISDDKRREVAARLRGLDVEITSRDTLERAVDKFMKAVCGDIPFSPIRYSVRNLCGLAAMLADLIESEPERTCRMDKSEFADFAPEYEGLHSCHKCGEQTAVLACVNEDGDMEWVKPRFCGYCGAKVVEK